MYSSMKSETREERLDLFEAVTNAEPLEDHINECIMVQDVTIQPVEFVDSVTGEYKMQNRITLITPDKDAFACTSLGVETSLKQLFGIVGNPPWVPALPLKAVKQQGNGKYKFTSLQLFK
jgi:hypothetical protein